jgi:alkyl hydroperoxide reductase subunit F
MIYDVAIIGGGPAGVAAGVYAARKRLKTIFLTKDFEGQSSVSLDIQNWIGTISITGTDLSQNLEKHLRAVASDVVTIKTGQYVTAIKKDGDTFEVSTSKETFTSKTILITAGSRRRKLEVPGAEEFDNKGLTYCASCDGPLFADMDVAVIGGGNAAFDTAAQLVAYTKSVTLLHRRDSFKADPITVEMISKHPKVKIITNAELKEIKGDSFVTGLTYRDTKTGKTHELAVKGIFAEIGSLPNTDFIKNIVELDPHNHIKVDHRNQRTSLDGIWAAGDATDTLYHQNNIAAGDAIKALEDIYLYIQYKK